jgi:DNA-directed RNA polymerase subunit alpha
MKWKPIQMPKEIVLDQSLATENYSRFIIEPLERGFGVTLGNSLRRVLLSSIQGAAVVSLRVEGALHEFTAIEGLYEDVTELVLNIKKMRVKLHADHLKTLSLKVSNKGKITAEMFNVDPEVEILNPDLHIAELVEDRELGLEIDVDSGRSYVLADLNRRSDAPVGTVYVDSLFSPIVKVNFDVEQTRVGQRTDFDRLIMEITTDGSITSEDALSYAAKILKDHLQQLIHIDEEIEIEEEEVEDEETVRIRQLLKTRVDELELSVRSSNCLRAANIQSLNELVSKTESEMLKYRNFGRKSLNELNAILDELNLSFGMDISKYLEPEKTT